MTSRNDLPCICSKKDFKNIFWKVSRSEMNNEIWEAIMDSRGCSLEEAKKTHNLRKNEVRKVMEALGEMD